ncbi:MAG: flagellar motor switch protein FliN [Planctomycetes bacterium]|nr:flagellar motor switch protein FliN [Planctomycetota bacterium]
MADDSEQVGQDEIENLLRQAQDTGGATPPPSSPPPTASDADAAVDQAEIEALLSGNAPAAAPAAPAASDADASVDQSEIEALLSGNAPAAAPAAPPVAPSAPVPTASAPAASGADVSQNDIELLLNKAEQALASVDQPNVPSVSALPPGLRSFEFKKFSGTAANTESATLELMRDVQLDLTIELGRTHMHLEDVLRLKQGAIVPLDKLAGDPADIYVNGRLVARGEVLVLNDNFCIRVAELIVGESACA